MKMATVVLPIVLWPATAFPDGGTVRLRESTGSFAITVFTAPEPLRAGLVDVSVLVQDRTTTEVALDAEVTLTLHSPDGAAIRTQASRAKASNKLLQAATLDLAFPGTWVLSVDARRGDDRARVSCTLAVEPATRRLARVWPLLALPPGVIALFVLNQRLRPPRL